MAAILVWVKGENTHHPGVKIIFISSFEKYNINITQQKTLCPHT